MKSEPVTCQNFLKKVYNIIFKMHSHCFNYQKSEATIMSIKNYILLMLLNKPFSQNNNNEKLPQKKKQQ